MAQNAVSQIRLAAIGINDMAVFILGEGVNGQIAALQILFKGDVRGGMTGEASITDAGFALGTRQRVLLAALRMQEDRKIAAYLLVARIKHLLRCGAYHHPVFIFDRQT